jgi:excisionase family DNA binding protein
MDTHHFAAEKAAAPVAEAAAFSVDEFCRAYSVSRASAYAPIKSGELRAVRFRSKLLISRSAAAAWFHRLDAV